MAPRDSELSGPDPEDLSGVEREEEAPTTRFVLDPSGDMFDTTLADSTHDAPPGVSLGGDRIGRYVVFGLLGQGGMGEVYTCYDEDLDREVAVKLLRDSVDRGRLLREARGLARLSHPNVVAIYEVGEHEGAPFLAMELVVGETLGNWLAAEDSGQPRSPKQILDVLMQAGRGLEAAHSAGLVHRDFKPDNVIVGADGRVRVLDFGLARGLEDGAAEAAKTLVPTQKRPNVVVGTPNYMALEQWSGRPCSPATDQFSFCVVAHEALYGVRPFVAERYWQLPDRIADAQLVPISPDSGVPERLYAAILRGLAGDPARRWPSLGALLAAFEAPTGLIDFSAERGRHKHFFGRADILASFDSLLRTWDSGWTLITGGPGMGKSAILNRWLELRERDKLPTAFHFIRRNHKNWADPEAIRANLAAQIEDMFPALRDPNASAEDRLEQLLARVSPVLASCAGQLVLLVDGLDEAMELGRGNPVPMIFPLELPSRVYVFAASRPRFPHLSWFQRRTGPTHRVDLEQLAQSNEAAVRGYWTELARQMARPPGADLIEAAIAGAQGNLQHAVKLRELWTTRAERSVDDVPAGFEGMIDGLLERIGELPRRERRLIWDGLLLLCAARESLPLAAVEELLDWDEGDATEEFLPLAREMLLEEQGAWGPVYRLFHERFSERVDKARPRTMSQHHQRLASYAAWPLRGDGFCRAYTLQHRVAHQIAAGDIQGAAATCADVGYLTAKAVARGVFEVELELRAAAQAQGRGDQARQLATLARIVGACSHWARNNPHALPALLHDRALSNAPKLMAALTWPEQLSAQPRLRHPLQMPNIARMLRGQRSWAVAVVVLPGARVAAGSDQQINVWDVESGRLLARLEGHTRPVSALAALADGRLVSAATDDEIYLWPASAEQSRVTLERVPGTVTVLAALGDARVIGGDDQLRVWELDSGRIVATLGGHEAPVTALVVLADGRVAVGDYELLRVWDVDAGTSVLATPSGGHGVITALALLPDARLVLGFEDGAVSVWDIESGASHTFAQTHATHVTAIVVRPDGLIISSSFSKSLCVWQVETHQAVIVPGGHETAVCALALLPDGRLVSGGADSTVRVMQVMQVMQVDQVMQVMAFEPDQVVDRITGHSERVRALALLPGGRVVSGSQDKTLRVWSMASGRTTLAIEAHAQRIGALATLPNGQLVSGSDDKTLRIWASESGELLRELVGHHHPVTTLAVLPDGRVVSGSQDNSVRVWELEGGRSPMVLTGHQSVVTALAVLPNGRLLSSSQDWSLRIWDLDRGRELQVIENLPDYVNALAVLPDGLVAAGSQDGVVRIWDAELERPIERLDGHQHAVTALAVLPNGQLASCSRDHTVRIWGPIGGRSWVGAHARRPSIVHADAPLFALVAVDVDNLVAGDALGNVWFIDLSRPG